MTDEQRQILETIRDKTFFGGEAVGVALAELADLRRQLATTETTVADVLKLALEKTKQWQAAIERAEKAEAPEQSTSNG
jgi:hypothetical protein